MLWCSLSEAGKDVLWCSLSEGQRLSPHQSSGSLCAIVLMGVLRLQAPSRLPGKRASFVMALLPTALLQWQETLVDLRSTHAAHAAFQVGFAIKVMAKRRSLTNLC